MPMEKAVEGTTGMFASAAGSLPTEKPAPEGTTLAAVGARDTGASAPVGALGLRAAMIGQRSRTSAQKRAKFKLGLTRCNAGFERHLGWHELRVRSL